MWQLISWLHFWDSAAVAVSTAPVRFNPTMGLTITFAPSLEAPTRFSPTFTP